MYSPPRVVECQACGTFMFSSEMCANPPKCCSLVETPDPPLPQLILAHFQPEFLCSRSRLINSELASGVLFCTGLRTDAGIRELSDHEMPTMLYLSGIAQAFSKNENSLIFYDRSSAHKPGDRLAIEIFRDVLAETSPYIQNDPRPLPTAHLVVQGAPSNHDEIGVLLPDLRFQPAAIHGHQVFDVESCLLEPLLYPLLFPNGEDGWSPCQQYSLFDYVKSKLFKSRLVTVYGRLGQSWLLHQYSRYRYIQAMKKIAHQDVHSQIIKRLCSYSKFCQYNNLDPSLFGRLSCVPSTFHGSPAMLRQRIEDIGAIIEQRGQPDFFITFTASPDWPEVRDMMAAIRADNCNLANHVNIVNRAFYKRLKHLLKALNDGFFGVPGAGETPYYICTIEFQKRLLVHAHILHRSGISQHHIMRNIDNIVTCALPLAGEPLHDIVARKMHHRCSERCFPNGRTTCKFGFPKQQCEHSHIAENGRLILRRSLRESNIVAYNPQLLAIYEAHINVEYVTDMQRPSYLCKYINKPADLVHCVEVTLDTNPRTLVMQFLQCTFVSAAQAAWEFSGFPTVFKSVTVDVIHIDLPGHEVVVNNLQTPQLTAILRYFVRPHTRDLDGIRTDFDNMTISDYYSTFTVAKNISRERIQVILDEAQTPYFKFNVCRRKHQQIIRVSTHDPFNAELSALRCLLQVTPCRSFEQLRTLAGTEFPTFYETARARNLIPDDELLLALREAARTPIMTPSRMLQLFTTCLLNGLAQPLEAFRMLAHLMFIDDNDPIFQPVPPLSVEHESTVLRSIEKILQRGHYTLEQFGLPLPLPGNSNHQNDVDISLIEQRFNEYYHALDTDQRRVVDFFNFQPVSVLVDAPGGYGKSYMSKALCLKFAARNIPSLSVTFQASAARQLLHGRTIHNAFGFGIKQPYVSKFDTDSPQVQSLLRVQLIIIDEIFAVDVNLISAVVTHLQLWHACADLFQIVSFLFIGDPRQLAPVLAHNTEAETINHSIISSDFIHRFVRMKLTQPHRFSSEWAHTLLSIGNGETFNPFVLPASLSFTSISDFRETCRRERNPSVIPTIIAPTNSVCDEHNDFILSLYTSAPEILTATNAFADLHCPIDPAFLSNIPSADGFRQVLTVARGSSVMVIRNIDQCNGIVNGAMYTVEYISPRLMHLRSHDTGSLIFMPRIKCHVEFELLTFTRTQFPCVPAASQTIHKFQGSTVQKLILDLRIPLFAHGQLYVALSRTRLPENTIVILEDLSEPPCTNNIVYSKFLAFALTGNL